MATKPKDDAAQQEQDEELIPVETPPAEVKKEDDDDDDKDLDVSDDDDDDDDDDEEDSRLSKSQDDEDEEVTNPNRARRKKRREMQRRAREAQERKMAALERQLEQATQRLAAVEGFASQSTVQSIEQQIVQAQREVQQAEIIISKATEAGNGDDVVAAMRIRDEVKDRLRSLEGNQRSMKERGEQKQTPQVDPNVVGFAKQWMQANPWYNPNGADRDSALTRAIDTELAQEGYNPAMREYWEELTNRVAEAFGDGQQGADKGAPQRRRKTPPPMGNRREHAPASTRKEIYVTPERKQAMIEAGVWDDPVQRQRYLRAYRDYDQAGPAR